MNLWRPRHRCLASLWAGTLACATLLACADVPAGFGPNPVAARTNADGLFGSFTLRFTNVYRTARYARARELLGRYALTPSVIYSDTSIWTVVTPDDTHTLFGDASFVNNRYTFTNVPTANSIDTLAEGRHIMRLHKLRDNEYEWFTGVDFAAGSVTANDMARLVNCWLASAEGRSGSTLRSDSRRAFPHSTAALGALFTLDTLTSVHDNAGGNTVYMGIRITPDGIRAMLPHYAAFLDKYAERVKLRFTLLDAHGAQWFDATARDGYLTVRLRSHDGHFAPLEGPITRMPDTLVLRVDMTAKISLFTVGVKQLVGEWVNVHSDHERGWAMRFTHEPEWQLPPTVGYFIRSPLRRPFQGDGTQFRLLLHDTPGHQTLISRRGTTTVQESAVLRFLGRLGGKALGDFVAKAEEEENIFDASVFSALRNDTDAILR